jgi:hypothetical protein
MAHAIIWKYTDQEGNVRVLTGQPATFAATDQEAVSNAKLTLEKMNGTGQRLQPLCVVETDGDFHEDVYARPELDLGPEEDYEIFYDISDMHRWQRREWWPL